ncbi:MAG: 2Fe-2S iron-sulfur cluster-binding protein [Chloroflexota bacterium]
MRTVTLEIDGKKVKAREGLSLLEAARDAGVHIPSLCYHEKLLPQGACRLCMVEISRKGRARLVASCAYEVEDGLVVNTQSPKVLKVRKVLWELLLASSPTLASVAQQYGVTETRFESDVSQCTLCGVCVRYCAEVKKANALTFVGRGIDRRVAFVDEVVSTGVCMDCRECFGLCATGKIPRETDGACFDGLTVRDFIGGRHGHHA